MTEQEVVLLGHLLGGKSLKFPDHFLVCHVFCNFQKRLDEDMFQDNLVDCATNGG